MAYLNSFNNRMLDFKNVIAFIVVISLAVPPCAYAGAPDTLRPPATRNGSGANNVSALVLAHRQHMAELSQDRTAWENEWQIERLIFSPGGIQHAGLTTQGGESVETDEFNDKPHWVYVLVNMYNGRCVYVGPDDIVSLFPLWESRAAGLRREKAVQLADYREKVTTVLACRNVLQIDDEEISHLEALRGAAALGDVHFIAIDEFYSALQTRWQQHHADVAFERFLEMMDDIERLVKALSTRRISILRPAEQRTLAAVATSFEEGAMIDDTRVAEVIALHARLLAYQNHLVHEARAWGQGRAVSVSVEQEARTPAYHANLWIANWLFPVLRANGNRPLLLDVGANMSVFYRIARQVLQGDDREITRGIVDMEKEEDIYQTAPNPHRVQADISALTDERLPVIENATDAMSAEALNSAHRVSVVVASFVLDQLPAEAFPKALVAFDHLLANPPEEDFSPERAGDFPLFIVASPENSPIDGSSFHRTLLDIGYEVVVAPQYNQGSTLTEEAQVRILEEEGRERLEQIKALVAKPFHVAVYAKTKSVSEQDLLRRVPKELSLRTGAARRRARTGASGEAPESLTRLDPARLLALDVITTLSPEDFQAQGYHVVSRNTIEDEIAYDDFEDNIALLVYYRDFLPSPQQRQLDAIVTLWDRQEAAFLTQEQVQFVMRAPRATYVAHQRAIDRYPYLRRSLERDFERSVDSAIAAAHKLRHSVEQAARQEERRLRTSTRHSLHTLYEEESEYRAQHRRISVFDETRPQRAILRRNIRRALATLEGAVSMEQIAVAAGLSRPTLYAYDIYRLGEREIRRRAAREVARPQLIMPREREMDPEPAVRNALMMLEGTQTQRHIAEVAGIHWGTFSGEQYEQFVREENERRVAAESPMQPIVLRSEEIQNADQRVVDVLRAWPEDTPVTEAGIARELHMSRNTVRPLLRAAFDAVNQERAAQEKPPLAIYKRRTTDTRAAVEEGLKKLPGGTVTMEAIADASGVSRATLFLEKNRPMVDELMAVDNVRRTAAGIQTIQLSYTWTRPDDIRAGLRTLEGPVYISQVLSAIGVQDRGILERVDIHAFIAEENTRRSKEEPDRAPISIRKEPEVAIRDALVDFDGEEIGLAQLSRAADVSISTLYNYDVRAIAASAGRLRRKKGKNPVRITPYARATKKTPQIRHALKDISGEVTLEQIAAAADVDPHTLYANDVFGLVEDVNASREGSDTQPITIVHARWGTPLNPPSRGQTDGSA